MEHFKTCLLVDDDLDDHEIFSLALKEAERPVELVRAYDGVDALNHLRDGLHERPDFIFLDLNMPRMDGKHCLQLLKDDSELKDIPVVIYTTSSEIKDLIEAQRLGAIAFIVKSASIHELTLALQDFFREREP
jgi:CheY-like chemotaxis protein